MTQRLDEAARVKLTRDERRARVLAYLAELERAAPIAPAARKRAARLVRKLTGR